jgi:sec-independent protein translocase protein TatA
MPFGLGWPELLIILVVAILLFGGSRLAGIGKGTGRAIREFKEETQGLREADKQKAASTNVELDSRPAAPQAPVVQAPTTPTVADAQTVEQPKQN